MNGKKAGRLLRRALALGVGTAVLGGLLSSAGALALPALWQIGDGAALAQALLDTEVGSFSEDEPSLWSQMVTSELPLSTQSEAADEEDADLEVGELEDAEAVLPATDSLQTEDVEATEATEPDDTSEGSEDTSTAEDDSAVVWETISDNSSTVSGGGVSINNETEGITVDPSALVSSVLTQTISPASEGPQILIMHTHGSEAYTMSGDDVYEESDTSRTTDTNYNVVRVGEAMKEVFESMGFSVIHDTTLYDYPGYNGSYSRSLAGIQSILEQCPTISIVLDVHRDALIASDGTVYKTVTQIDGESAAQVMIVVGTDDGGLDHPNWQENLALAAHIQLSLTSVEPALARPIDLRSQRFNQHMTTGSLLVEVGTSGNTLQEALRGARYFAQAAGEVFQTLLTD